LTSGANLTLSFVGDGGANTNSQGLRLMDTSYGASNGYITVDGAGNLCWRGNALAWQYQL
jgi:hypothetical protein